MSDLEQIAYAKTVYGQEEIDAVVKCLSESTQMGNYSRPVSYTHLTLPTKRIV